MRCQQGQCVRREPTAARCPDAESLRFFPDDVADFTPHAAISAFSVRGWGRFKGSDLVNRQFLDRLAFLENY